MEENKDHKYIHIGKRIQELRKNAEMTQQELAKQAGYETSTAISLIESGKRRVQLVELEDLAKVLNTTAEYLLTGTEVSTDIGLALRAEKNLDPQEIKQVESFIDFIKSQRNEDANGKR